jgi:Mg-chelatase subunit ChlD
MTKALAILGALAALIPIAARADEVPAKVPQKAPRVEVVFTLDTTGSMGGLLDGAKKKIWSIASEIARAQPRPDVKIGLVAYRDRGDEYVTKVLPLTDDLDRVYKELSTYRADGGGDEPEDVRSALRDAIGSIQWSRDPSVVRIIFLVGDAPPHMDYQDVPTIGELCRKANEAGIVINTIRCGPSPETGRIWQEIARSCEGKFFTIDQGGGVVAIATPFDRELAELGDKLSGTVVAFGGEGRRAEALEHERTASAMPAAARADRAGAKAAGDKYSDDDLVDAVRDGKKKLSELKNEELPPELAKLDPKEREAWLAKKTAERDEIRAKILEVAKKRDEFLRAELDKRGTKDSFDQVVLDALKEQAKKAGLTFGG